MKNPRNARKSDFVKTKGQNLLYSSQKLWEINGLKLMASQNVLL